MAELRSPVDRLIGEFDRALRAIAGVAQAARPSPAAAVPETEMNDEERAHAAALMRVNHVGEVCAQALYQARRSPRAKSARAALEEAAREEEDHLRLERGPHRRARRSLSLLNPLWYAGSFYGRGGARLAIAGISPFLPRPSARSRSTSPVTWRAAGRGPPHAGGGGRDARRRARHRASALRLGAAELPGPVKLAMRLASRVMTTLAYRL